MPERPEEETGAERVGDYDAGTIQVLDGIEHVRRRPAMYIGDTGERGLHQLVEEVVANSVDEALAGACDTIEVRLYGDGSISVTDNGRGIPVEMHPESGRPALEVVMTTLNAGGKFDHESYKVSAGLHGVGVSCVNALSEWLEVRVWRGGQVHYQRYERGEPRTEVERRGRTERCGTSIRFRPDPEIFRNAELRWERIARRLRELAFLNSGLRIHMESDVDGRSETFYYEGGIRQFVEFLNEGKDPVHEVVYISHRDESLSCEVAFQYNSGFQPTVYSFANNINTVDGGTHLSALWSAITRTFNAYGRSEGLLRDMKVTGQDYREGLTAVISIKVPDPQFEGQTKMRLGNREVGGAVEQMLNEKLSTYCEEHPETARRIVAKALGAAQAREAARKARDLTRRKGALSGANLPGKLRDCSSRDVESTELFIVEGQSAGGTAGMGRDRRLQAILPLRGVILNVEKARVDKMLTNAEIRALIRALGTGIGPEEFDASKLRYGKIIIMTDADIDGAHIRTLLLTFFFRQMPQLIDDGRIYVAQPPLYRLTRKGQRLYVHDDRELQRTLLRLGVSDATLWYSGDGSPAAEVPSEGFQAILDAAAELEGIVGRIEARGVPFGRYVASRRPGRGHGCPLYQVVHVDGRGERHEHLFYSEDEYDAFLMDLRRELAEQGQEVEIVGEERGPCEAELRPNSVRAVRFEDAARTEALIARIEAHGIPAGSLLAGGQDGPYFEVRADGAAARAGSLLELLPVVRELGRRGLDIQRYKGLGEMDAGELAETTLAPASRKTVQITIGDAVRADNYFSILAGKDVKRRREFIERHALEVSNLDV